MYRTWAIVVTWLVDVRVHVSPTAQEVVDGSESQKKRKRASNAEAHIKKYSF